MSTPRPLVLLLTHSKDHYTVDRVQAALAALGARPLRVDTDRFPSDVRLGVTLGPDGERRELAVGDERVCVDGARAVWARRIWTARADTGVDERYREASRREAAAALFGFLGGLGEARWVNPPGAQRDAEDKLRQLALAREIGWPVPSTLVTNDPERVREFWDAHEGRVVTKMLTPLSVSMEGGSPFVYTSAVGAGDLDHLDGLRHCPMVFQERIEKELELRVVCVGERVFVGAIDASRSAEGRVDWRRSRPSEVGWTRGDLPADVAEQAVRIVRRLGLVYGAVDVVRTPRGEHVFLEINPAGEWGMLERDLGLSISESLAHALLEPAS